MASGHGVARLPVGERGRLTQTQARIAPHTRCEAQRGAEGSRMGGVHDGPNAQASLRSRPLSSLRQIFFELGAGEFEGVGEDEGLIDVPSGMSNFDGGAT